MRDDNDTRPLTVGEVARLCGVSRVSVLNWIQERGLQAFTTPGGHHRLQRRDVAEFLARQSMPVPADLGPETRPTILVVDDEHAIRDFVVVALEPVFPGYGFETCASGYDALLRIGARPPALLILDLAMPGVDGFEVCRRIRSLADTRDVRILVMTGVYGQAEEKSMRAIGIDGWIPKPFKLEGLTAAVTAALRSGTGSGATPGGAHRLRNGK
ncbi:MAG: response regulator [Planctomycetes bacterium]|nr:response regulator [Planctomycetota bacterium]